jgi:hypothetical protein
VYRSTESAHGPPPERSRTTTPDRGDDLSAVAGLSIRARTVWKTAVPL